MRFFIRNKQEQRTVIQKIYEIDHSTNNKVCQELNSWLPMIASKYLQKTLEVINNVRIKKKKIASVNRLLL